MEFSLLHMSPVVVAIVWLTVFIVTGRTKTVYDRLLLALLAVSAFTCYIFVRMTHRMESDALFMVLDTLEGFLAPAICPLLLLYIKSIMHESQWKSRNWLWLLPSIVVGGSCVIITSFVGYDRIIENRSLHESMFVPSLGQPIEQAYWWINVALFNIVLIAMSAAILAWCIVLLYRYRKRLENYYANIENKSLRNLHAILVTSMVSMVLMGTLSAAVQPLVRLIPQVDVWFAVVSAMLLWCMAQNAYRIQFSVENGVPEEEEENVVPEVAEKPDDKTAVRTKEAVEAWIAQSDLPYCKEGLTADDVAVGVGVSRHALHQFIRSSEYSNFNTWINTLRIREACRRIDQGDYTKLAAVGLDCGYSDPAHFNRAFHKIMGCSPSEYMKR